MSRICTLCGKKPTIGNKRQLLIGHYNPLGKRRVFPNLQWTMGPAGKRVKVCTRCLKTASTKKTKAKKS